MAVDHALMRRARESGEGVCRIYAWDSPVISLGRNQRALGAYDDGMLRDRGIGVVRRPTGGRALLHDREITYSVTAPVAAGGDLASTYARINALLLSALETLGVPATLARPSTRARQPGSTPCFAEPALGEIVAGGRKLVGSAQWREDGVLLQHGSILVEDDQSLIPSLMRSPFEPTPPPATLRELLGRVPEPGEFTDALFGAVRAHFDPFAHALSGGDLDAHAVASLTNHYRDAAWTWRR